MAAITSVSAQQPTGHRDDAAPAIGTPAYDSKLSRIAWRKDRFAVAPAEVRIAACRQALARGSGNATTGTLLLSTLIETSRVEEAIAFVRADPRPPGLDADWDYHVSRAWQLFGDPQAALDHTDAALSSGGSQPGLLLRRFALLVSLERMADAATMLEDLLHRPDILLSPDMIKMLRQSRGNSGLLDLLEARPGLFRPGDRIECLVNGLFATGRGDEARALMDADTLVERIALEIPGVSDMAEFTGVLSEEIAALPRTTIDPNSPSSRAGLHMKTITFAASMCRQVLAAARDAVEDYAARRAHLDNVFIAATPRQAAIKAWVAAFERGGEALAHNHPHGWLSGVFYVAVPEADTQAGALVLPLAPGDEGDTPWPVHTLVPTPGELILFPSYFRHRTLPYRGPGWRISLAFDVLPYRGGKVG